MIRSDVDRDSEGEIDHGSPKNSEGESSSEEESDLEEDQDNSNPGNGLYSSENSEDTGGEAAILPSIASSETLSNLPADVRSGDLAKIVDLQQHRPLTNQERMYVLEHSFVPHSGYNFPIRTINGCKRHFQPKWLEKYNGLVYSESIDGGYCKYCALFAKCGPTVTELGVLVNKPLTNFKKATEKLDKHFFETQFHKLAVQAAMMFSKVQQNKALSIDQQLNTLRQERIAQNRAKLRSIVETVIFCGRQGIALRGHQDDQTHVESNPLSNHGNFLALLRFRVQAGDQVLGHHLGTAPANALYVSKTIQNELISICGNHIQEKILKEVRIAGFYSVIADEATDAANQEQLSITIRYVGNDVPCEKFLGFLHCQTGVTGEAIAGNILSQLNTWQLPTSLLRGQSYDGAGSMSGSVRGAAARICADHPKALYVHCAAHRLNLCIMKCCSIREISNMIQTVGSVARFFNNSPKRQLSLEKWISEVLPTEEKRRKLKDLCRTRWVERHEAYEVFIDLFLPLISCLEEIARASPSEWNRDTRSEAHSFLVALSQFSFIVTLVITEKILAYTKGLSIKLQGRYIDAVRAHSDIESVKSTLSRCRSQVDDFHKRLYEEATQVR